MIQRIQTVYLLALIVCAVCLFFIPISSVSSAGAAVNRVSVLHVNSVKVFENNEAHVTTPVYDLLVVNVAIILLAALTIVLFKKRKLQLMLCRLLMVMIIVLVLLAFRNTDALSADEGGVKAIYQAGAYMVVVSLLFVYLAMRGIKNDEDFIRSSERLR